MNIYGSLMGIFDKKTKTFMSKKNKELFDEKHKDIFD